MKTLVEHINEQLVMELRSTKKKNYKIPTFGDLNEGDIFYVYFFKSNTIKEAKLINIVDANKKNVFDEYGEFAQINCTAENTKIVYYVSPDIKNLTIDETNWQKNGCIATSISEIESTYNVKISNYK